MLKHLAATVGVLAVSAVLAVVALYVLLVIGSRRSVEYYYGR